MAWKELWSAEIASSKSVSVKISISETEDAGKILGVRKWIQRGAEKYPAKDGFAVQFTREMLDQLISALEETRAYAGKNRD